MIPWRTRGRSHGIATRITVAMTQPEIPTAGDGVTSLSSEEADLQAPVSRPGNGLLLVSEACDWIPNQERVVGAPSG